jgi:NDP-sugar pyrophosphorylase family protein
MTAAKRELEGVVLVLPAGGRGERMAAVTQTRNVNKAALKIGKLSIIGRTLEMYARAGVTRVVALVFHNAGSVVSALKDAGRLGVEVSYSRDPAKPVGKGGAIRIALERGIIPEDAPLIVHNPDDQIVGIERRFPRLIFARHRAVIRGGGLATAVCVPETDYQYSAFTARKGMARSAVMYPKVRMPTHTGITLFAPGAVRIFRKLIAPGRKVDFESVILPYLARRGRLGLAMIPTRAWIPVNDLKGYNKLLSAIKSRG